MSHISFANGSVIPASWLNDVDTVVYTYFGNGTSLNSPTKLQVAQGVFSTSVVTPLVGPATDTALNFQINSVIQWQFREAALGFRLIPAADNLSQIGQPDRRILTVFTPIIDSGTTGSLSLKTNNGTTQVTVVDGGSNNAPLGIAGGGGGAGPTVFTGGALTNASLNFTTRGTGTHNFFTGNYPSTTLQLQIQHVAAVNFFELFGAVAAGRPQFRANGSDPNVSMQFSTKGAADFLFQTDMLGTPANQFQVVHTASANRFITVTGSNGGNPQLGTTTGGLNLVPSSGQLLLGGVDMTYSQGTWTPSVGGTATYTTQTGTYTKIGRLVFIQGVLTINTIGTGSQTQISGLPFTPAQDATITVTLTTNLATAVVSLIGAARNVDSKILLNTRVAATAAEATAPSFQNATSMTFSGCYQV